MKKIMTLILSLFLMSTLVGCKSEDEEPIKKQAKEYVELLEKGDFDKASKLCDKSTIQSIGLNDIDTYFDKQIASYLKGTNQSFKDNAKEYKEKLKKAVIKKAVMNDDFDNDNKMVSANVDYMVISKESNEAVSKKITSLTEEYTKAHHKELKKIFTKKGKKAYEKAIYNGVAKDFFEYMKNDYIASIKYEKQRWRMRFAKTKGKWIINRVSITKAVKQD